MLKGTPGRRALTLFDIDALWGGRIAIGVLA
jgi:hypothetical protein